MVGKRVLIPLAAILFLLATVVGFVFNLVYYLNQKSFNWFYFGVFILLVVITIIFSRVIDSFGPEITYNKDLYSLLPDDSKIRAEEEHKELEKRSKPYFYSGLFIFVIAIITLIVVSFWFK